MDLVINFASHWGSFTVVYFAFHINQIFCRGEKEWKSFLNFCNIFLIMIHFLNEINQELALVGKLDDTAR